MNAVLATAHAEAYATENKRKATLATVKTLEHNRRGNEKQRAPSIKPLENTELPMSMFGKINSLFIFPWNILRQAIEVTADGSRLVMRLSGKFSCREASPGDRVTLTVGVLSLLPVETSLESLQVGDALVVVDGSGGGSGGGCEVCGVCMCACMRVYVRHVHC